MCLKLLVIATEQQSLSHALVSFETNLKTFLKNKSHVYYQLLIKIEQWVPPKMTLEECFQAGILYCEEAWNSENVEQIGVIAIFDLAGFSFEHAKACTPFQIHRLIKIFWVCFCIMLFLQRNN